MLLKNYIFTLLSFFGHAIHCLICKLSTDESTNSYMHLWPDSFPLINIFHKCSPNRPQDVDVKNRLPNIFNDLETA